MGALYVNCETVSRDQIDDEIFSIIVLSEYQQTRRSQADTSSLHQIQDSLPQAGWRVAYIVHKKQCKSKIELYNEERQTRDMVRIGNTARNISRSRLTITLTNSTERREKKYLQSTNLGHKMFCEKA